MIDITDADYTHTKRVCKDFEIKHLRFVCFKSLRRKHNWSIINLFRLKNN